MSASHLSGAQPVPPVARDEGWISRRLQGTCDMVGVASTRRRAAPSLHSLVAQACGADPADRLISPVGEGIYSTLFGLIPTALAVLRTATAVEPDPLALMAWYRHTPIAELGYLTAEQLVALGRADAVITLLQSVYGGARD